MMYVSPLRPFSAPLVGLGSLVVAACLTLGACATQKPLVPPPASPAVPVYIPVVKPCEVVKVEKSPLVTEKLGAGDDLYEAVKRVLADRSILLGDREKLSAANSDPCPSAPAKSE